MRVISRDPFARLDVVRETLTGFTVDRFEGETGFGARLYSCDWCGTTRWTRGGHPFAYRYGTQDDNGRTGWDSHRFCSKSCRDSYTN